MSQLDLLLDEGIVDEVLGRLQSGKEADVYLVRRGNDTVAAKVYKERDTRSFKNNSAYTEERKVRNSRTQRAVARGSRFGKQAAEEEWKSAEANALYKLHAQGWVRVPTPVMFYEGVLLMHVVTDAEGYAAPRLIDAPLTAEQAGPLYLDLRRQLIGMLCCEVIHADLSPYNVLLAAEGPTIIDFPQMVSAAHNRQSESFFLRDFDNLFQFLCRLDPRLRRQAGDAREIWRTYLRRELTPDYVPPVPRQEEFRPQRRPEPEQRPSFGQRPSLGQQGRPPQGHRPPQDQRPPQFLHPSQGTPSPQGRPPAERPAHEGRPPQRHRPPQGPRPQQGRPAQQHRPPQGHRPAQDQRPAKRPAGDQRPPQGPRNAEGQPGQGTQTQDDQAGVSRQGPPAFRGHRGGARRGNR